MEQIEHNSKALVTINSGVPQDVQAPLTAQEIKAQVQLIQQVTQAVMQEGFHYGVIPGTDKPTLLKPGAEKLTLTFRLAPELRVEMRDLGNGHREYQVRCLLTHIPTGRFYGEGVGSCSTMESRYRYRTAALTCPHCGNAAIIKGKAEYGGGWLCFQRKGGCGAKYGNDDPQITSQASGRVENADIADVYNTVLKMAKKRALVDATLTATAASDLFTQDLEDNVPPEMAAPTPQAALKTAPTAKPGCITEPQRRRLFAFCKECNLKTEDLKTFLSQVHKIESTTDIPAEQYDLICQQMADGAVAEFLKGHPAPAEAK